MSHVHTPEETIVGREVKLAPWPSIPLLLLQGSNHIWDMYAKLTSDIDGVGGHPCSEIGGSRLFQGSCTPEPTIEGLSLTDEQNQGTISRVPLTLPGRRKNTLEGGMLLTLIFSGLRISID